MIIYGHRLPCFPLARKVRNFADFVAVMERGVFLAGKLAVVYGENIPDLSLMYVQPKVAVASFAVSRKRVKEAYASFKRMSHLWGYLCVEISLQGEILVSQI